MQFTITRGVLIGDTWHEPGSIVSLDRRMAELFTKLGAAVPYIPAVEQATANHRSAERATAPRQR